MNKRRLNKELIFIYGIIALIFAVGILFVGLFFLNIEVQSNNSSEILAIYITLSTFIWGGLLCRNC